MRTIATSTLIGSRPHDDVLQILITMCVGLGAAMFWTSAGAYPALPVPPDTRLSIVADEMVVNGLPMRAYDIRSAMDVRNVADFYAHAWGDDVAESDMPPWLLLSHHKGDYLVTIHLRPHEEGGSGGFVGITRVLASSLRIHRPRFSKPPGSALVNHIESVDRGRQSRTVLLQNDASVAQNIDWYRQHYEREGWQVVGESEALPSAPDSGALLMNRRGGELNLAVTRSQGLSQVVIVVIE
jgi:hypothetical protein